MTDTQTALGFDALGLPDAVLQILSGLGYETPSAIQQAAIPALLAQRDVLGMAQTGTGKTAAFALPIVTRLIAEPNTQRNPVALVMAPTRELAQQVAQAFGSYAGKALPRRILSVYGGSPYGAQIRALKDGVDVVVGTPGRLMDLMRKGHLDVSGLRTLVLDEADEMLRMGFIDDVEWVLSHTPDERQIALFSATMPREIKRIADRYLNQPEEVSIKVATTTAATIDQRHILVHRNQKPELLARVLEVEPTDGVMVFVRTKIATEEVADLLRSRGFAAESLSGDLSQEQRDKTVQRLKAGKIDVVVATDVAARGLDVTRISHVINYDMPSDPEAYTHRIGRTGRAGRSGQAILFVQPRERRMLGIIEKVTRGKVELMEAPTVAQVNAARQNALQTRIERQLGKDLNAQRAVLDALRANSELDDADLALGLLAELTAGQPLVLDEAQELHAVQNRGPRGDKHDRGSKGGQGGERRPRRERPAGAEAGMERYRVEVGHNHGIKPGNLVGAISNEAGVDAKLIGRIDLFDDYSLLDLPEGMPKPIFKHLKTVWVCGQKLAISKDTGAAPADTEQTPPSKPRPGKPRKKPAGGKRKKPRAK
ncbi:DEAD/DEAH box helicase [bacterium]|nr:DEAD/DEAH box helicase [bacterium]